MFTHGYVACRINSARRPGPPRSSLEPGAGPPPGSNEPGVVKGCRKLCSSSAKKFQKKVDMTDVTDVEDDTWDKGDRYYMAQINLRHIDDKLYTAIKMRAVEENVRIREWIVGVLERSVERENQPPISSPTPPRRGASVSDAEAEMEYVKDRLRLSEPSAAGAEENVASKGGERERNTTPAARGAAAVLSGKAKNERKAVRWIEAETDSVGPWCCPECQSELRGERCPRGHGEFVLEDRTRAEQEQARFKEHVQRTHDPATCVEVGCGLCQVLGVEDENRGLG